MPLENYSKNKESFSSLEKKQELSSYGTPKTPKELETQQKQIQINHVKDQIEMQKIRENLNIPGAKEERETKEKELQDLENGNTPMLAQESEHENQENLETLTNDTEKMKQSLGYFTKQALEHYQDTQDGMFDPRYINAIDHAFADFESNKEMNASELFFVVKNVLDTLVDTFKAMSQETDKGNAGSYGGDYRSDADNLNKILEDTDDVKREMTGYMNALLKNPALQGQIDYLNSTQKDLEKYLTTMGDEIDSYKRSRENLIR